MPQIPLGKFHAGNAPGIDPIARGAILPAEGDRVIGDRQDPGIAEGGAGYLGPQIFERGSAAARRLDVHAPVHAPDLGVHLPVMSLKQPVPVLAKGAL